MKKRKVRLNFKKIFLLLLSWVFIILGYFFVKYRFLIVNSTIASNLVDLDTALNSNSEYKDIAEKNNSNYDGVR